MTPLVGRRPQRAHGATRPVLAHRRGRDGPYRAVARDADLVVVAPATADLLAKMANGLADDLASTLLLATDKRVLVAPAMNLRMWLHPRRSATSRSLRRTASPSSAPTHGEMACGEFGPGRMAEPLEIVGGDRRLLLARRRTSAGRSAGRPHALVTSGPTHEPIDPVRYIANRSSGKQGHAIAAAAAARRGARHAGERARWRSPDPPGVASVRVETAREMLAAVEAALAGRRLRRSPPPSPTGASTSRPTQKMKKGADGPPDAHARRKSRHPGHRRAAQARRPRLVVGFAAETERVVEHAREKLERKGLRPDRRQRRRAGTGVMGGDRNTVHLVTRDGRRVLAARIDKDEVASTPGRAHRRDCWPGQAMTAVAVEIRGCRMAEGLPLPRYQSDGAAGLDLMAAIAGGRSRSTSSPARANSSRRASRWSSRRASRRRCGPARAWRCKHGRHGAERSGHRSMRIIAARSASSSSISAASRSSCARHAHRATGREPWSRSNPARAANCRRTSRGERGLAPQVWTSRADRGER